MRRVKLHYLNLGSTYRKRNAIVDGLFLRNTRDKMLHSVSMPTVFPLGPVHASKDWEDFVTKDDPPPDLQDKRMVAYYEDGFPWPVPVDKPLTLREQEKEAAIVYEDAHQRNALRKSENNAHGGILRSVPVIVGAAVCSILVLVVGFTVVQNLWL
jgi:hypothetical protein